MVKFDPVTIGIRLDPSDSADMIDEMADSWETIAQTMRDEARRLRDLAAGSDDEQ